MNKELTSLFLLISALSTAQSYAGETGTHGGQGVVCKDSSGNINSVQIADYYEGLQTLPGTSLNLGDTSKGYMDIVEYVLNNLSKIDPAAADRYLAQAKTFESDTLFSKTPLTLIDDAHPPVQAQAGCSMAQFALQNYPLKALQTKYVVDQTIWNGADAAAKAGLVLHEVIYTDALGFGQTTSENTRYFNYVISSSAINNMSTAQYESILSSSGFDKATGQCLFSDFKNSIPQCLFVNGGRIPPGTYPFTLSSGQIVMVAHNPQNGDNYSDVFSLAGTVAAATEAVDLAQPTSIQIGNYSIQANLVGFDKDRNVVNLDLANSSVMLSTSAGTLTFMGGQRSDFDLTFFPNGTLENGYLGLTDPVSVKIGNSTIPARRDIDFDQAGNVVLLYPAGDFVASIGDQNIRFQGDGYTSSQFFPNGQIEAGKIYGGQSLTDTDGNAVDLKNGFFGQTKTYSVQFDSQGHVIHWE